LAAASDLDYKNRRSHFLWHRLGGLLAPVVQVEVTVNDRCFDAPVFVKGASHFLQEIVSLNDALDFLDDWSLDRWGPIYETALRACHRAYARDVPIATAKEAFVGFAESAGIFEEVGSFLAFPLIPQSGRGGLPT
jgi:hypothetical protein